MNTVIRLASGVLVAAVISVQSSWSAETSPHPWAGGAHFSKTFFNTLFGHPVDDSQRVREHIKSAITTGTSHVQGEVTVELMPDSSRGRLDICLRGTASINDAVATQGPIRVCSRAVTRVDVRKPVIFERDGLHDVPASARCSTNIRICDVQAGGRLQQRFGAQRSQRELPETECIVSQRATRRFEHRLNDRIGSAIEDIDGQLREQLQFDQAGFDFLPPEVSFASTRDHLQVWIQPQKDREVSPPPRESNLDLAWDVHVVLHEQVFETFGGYRLAGRRVDDQQVFDGVQAMRGDVPQSLEIDPEHPRWSMKMADSRPLRMRLPDGEIHAVIHLADFQYGPDVLAGPIHVALTLQPKITAEGPRLQRIAGPTVRLDETSGPIRTDQDSQLAELLRQKFADILPPEFGFDRQLDPDDDTREKLSQLALTQFNVLDGWLELAWRFPSEPTPLKAPGVE